MMHKFGLVAALLAATCCPLAMSRRDGRQPLAPWPILLFATW